MNKKHANKDAKVIAVSGGSSINYPVDQLQIASKLGAVYMMHKPIDGNHLVEVVDQLLL